MSTTKTQVPSIPAAPKNEREAAAFHNSVKEAIEVRLGRRGDPRDRAITLRELIDSGLAEELLDNPFDPNAGVGPTDFKAPPAFTDATRPPTPTGLSAAAGITKITLSWNNPQIDNLAHTEVWRATSNSLGNAVRHDTTETSVWVDSVDPGNQFYYWIRHITTSNIASVFAGSVNGTGALITAVETNLIPAGFFLKLATNTTASLSDSAFQSEFGRKPMNNDFLTVRDTNATPQVSKTYKYSGGTGGSGGGSFSDVGDVITGDLVVNGSIGASQISVSSLSALSANVGTLTSGTINAANMTVQNLSASSITTGTLNGDNVTVSNITAGSITSGELSATRINIDGATLSRNGNDLIVSASGIGTTQLGDAVVVVAKLGSASIGKSGFSEASGVNVGNSATTWAYYTAADNANWNVVGSNYMGGTSTAQVILALGTDDITEDGDLLVESYSQVYGTLPSSGTVETGHVIQVLKSTSTSFASPIIYWYSSTSNTGIDGHQLAPIINSFVIPASIFTPVSTSYKYWKFSMWTHFHGWSGTFGISKALIKINRLNKGTAL